ncbi:MAG: acyl-CoA dehydratase activase [Planctomycetota bacterium]
MITAGIDIGSVATKAAVLRDGEVVARSILRTGADPAGAASEALAAAAGQAGLERGQIERIVSTGYGRRTIGFADDVLTEITAGARGAYHVGCPWGVPRLIVDLGGQDTKVILLDDDGTVRDFAMNDKCAAGTGRFLEVMAGVLDVPLAELGAASERAAAPAPINATCTVFAESEVISLIAGGTPKEDIVAGLHAAIASRIAQMAGPMGGHDIFFNGGGALNAGVSRALKRVLGREVYVPPDPQHVVAAGAALSARVA